MMKFSYDPEARACYVTVDAPGGENARGIVAESETVSDTRHGMVNLDYRADGSLYGVEILLPDREG